MMSITLTHSTEDRVFSGRTNITDGFVPTADAPLVIALHGGTYSSEYFDIAGYSLLDRAAGEGIPVIALDRPNYGESTALETNSSIILSNAEILNRTIGSLWESYGGDAPGVVLIAHSIGAAIATAVAASERSWPLLGVALSGCLVRVPEESRKAWEALPPIPMIELPVPVKDQVMFGPAGTYAAEMPAASHPSNAPVPTAELLDITGEWIGHRARLCGQITVPVHHRQGEFDALWITSQDEIDEFRAGFMSAPSISSELISGSGHCIDFHLPGADFQASQLAFAKACAADAAKGTAV